MEEWLNSPEFQLLRNEFVNFGSVVHLVIMPAHPRFEMYDVLEANKGNGEWKLIAGYQAKTKKDKVDPAALPDSSSWLVFLDTTTTTKPREDGWIKLDQSQLSEFLGVSLWDCAKKLIAGSISCNFVLETSSNSFWLYNCFSLHKSFTHKCIVLFAT